MKKYLLLFFLLFGCKITCLSAPKDSAQQRQWIRINQLGYLPNSVKVAVWCSLDSIKLENWQLVNAHTKKITASGKAGKAFGAYAAFKQTYRLDFSFIKIPGEYYLQTSTAKSPIFKIAADVYKGSADFALRYMRQQRSGFNPYLKDSCHSRDGYTLYAAKAGLPDSSFVDVTGGWHDATDYLQYATTSATATYDLMIAYRDFPGIFGDTHAANGLEGSNKIPDVLDEANWGLQWLLKMFPSKDRMFNQIADDRDHISMRMPGQDTQYGRGNERPVYFLSGQPQQRGKFINATTGTSSTAAKFATDFALASSLNLMNSKNLFYLKAMEALNYANKIKGFTQTASVRSPYIYAEENWTDDMELAYANVENMLRQSTDSAGRGWYLGQAVSYARKERITPWLGADTAKHYQWYPFVNAGHYELLKQLSSNKNFPTTSTGFNPSFIQNFVSNFDSVKLYYKQGIEKVWSKAEKNAFYRGVPFIWCSNNLTVAFAKQCYWYRTETGDNSFAALEQANIDWLFGCNPWGTSMVYGLPAWGDTPEDPHSSFTHLKNYPIDGGLVDGPVYGSIFNNLIGLKLYHPDEYAEFQSTLAVYHDDFGDYSTNEPTMDGTASLIYLLASQEAQGLRSNKKTSSQLPNRKFIYQQGAIIRGDTSSKKIALIFSSDEFIDGAKDIIAALKKEKVKANFFFTGHFYNTPAFASIIKKLKSQGHYLGPHSNGHLLYSPWDKRDSLLVTQNEFNNDLEKNYEAMLRFGISKKAAHYFLPPYEWYNDTISNWTNQLDLQLINYSPGTMSNADYTWPELKNYRSSDTIMKSIKSYETVHSLNGYILLLHFGTDPKRTDKFYKKLPELIQWLKQKNYSIVRIEELLK